MKTKRLNEECLIISLRNREKAGYELLYDSYSVSLFGVINGIVREREVAEDLLSDTFLKIVISFDQYDPFKGRLFTWMVNICRNLCFDRLRSKEFKSRNRNLRLDDATELLEHYSTSINPSHLDLKKITARLAPKEKLLIDLTYFQGYSQREIAKELDIPLGTVKTRLRRAINELRLVFNYVEINS